MSFTLSASGIAPRAMPAADLTDAALHEPDGVYTILRAYHKTKLLNFDFHVGRLAESAKLAGIPWEHDAARIGANVCDALRRAGFEEARFRLTLPRENPGILTMTVAPFTPYPLHLYTLGAHTVTFRRHRENPHAKDNAWEKERAALLESKLGDAHEGLLTGPGGAILEGLSSNFYAVLDSELRTAREGVLMGSARRIIMGILPDDVPLREEPVTLDDLPRLSEAMISSSSRTIMPVTFIDGEPVGDGRPGPVWAALHQRYHDWQEAHLKDICGGEVRDRHANA